ATAARLRVAVSGHGARFLGRSLTPRQEKLLLATCNWLLGRDDRLARTHDDEGNPIPEWRYPRVELTQQEDLLWKLGAVVGLPVLFVFLGIVVWMVRRVVWGGRLGRFEAGFGPGWRVSTCAPGA